MPFADQVPVNSSHSIDALARKKEAAPQGVATRPASTSNFRRLSLFHTDRLDLLFSFGLGFKRQRPNLDPGRFGRFRLDDFTFLRRRLLNDIVVGACRRHQQPYGAHRYQIIKPT